ncbi:MAG: UvrD-helicase domain-containing protein, partial [Candidatus Cloacimonetes bacterium]|nr:UvrD-helicase domain-containing protein [Candidatus Cloacimonadota bacterium]
MSKPFALVLRASAGTGKTYRLSLEYVRLLLKLMPENNPDVFAEILVITFTRKATAELRVRILQHLRLLTQAPESNQVEKETASLIKELGGITEEKRSFLRKIFKRMQANRHKIMVRTIDGFTNYIFTRLIAPVKGFYQYSVSDTIDSEIVGQVLERVVSDPQAAPLFKQMTSAYASTVRDLSVFESWIRGILEKRYLLEIMAANRNSGEATDTAPAKAALYAKFRKEMIDIIDMLGRSTTFPLDKILKKNQLRISLGLYSTSKEELVFPEMGFSFFQSNMIDFTWEKMFQKRAVKKHPELEQYYNEKVYSLLTDAMLLDLNNEEKNLFQLTRHIYKIYDSIQLARPQLTYGDILYFTVSTLYNPAYSLIDSDYGSVTNLFYEYLTGRFRFVLIDEFQDTSLEQWMMLKPIVSELLSGMGQKGAGGIVIVGDEKQAIYGWRGGEMKLLDSVAKSFHTEQTEFQNLNTSFRSRPVVIRFINKLFNSEDGISAIMSQNVSDWLYQPVNSAFPDEEGYVQLHIAQEFRKGDSRCLKGDLKREFINEIVIPAIERGNLIPGKTAILARTSQQLEIFAYLLREQGISCTYEQTGSIVNDPVVKPFLMLLRFLYHDDFLALLGFLRSDYVGITGSELKTVLKWLDLKNNGNITSEEGLERLATVKPIGEFNRDILRIRALACELINEDSITRVLKKLYKEFASPKLKDSANLYQLMQLSVTFENMFAQSQEAWQYSPNPCGFINWLKEHEKETEFRRIDSGDATSVKL